MYGNTTMCRNTTDEKLDKIAEELNEIAIQLKSYNEIGRELLQIQRNMFNPEPSHRDYPYYDERRYVF